MPNVDQHSQSPSTTHDQQSSAPAPAPSGLDANALAWEEYRKQQSDYCQQYMGGANATGGLGMFNHAALQQQQLHAQAAYAAYYAMTGATPHYSANAAYSHLHAPPQPVGHVIPVPARAAGVTREGLAAAATKNSIHSTFYPEQAAKLYIGNLHSQVSEYTLEDEVRRVVGLAPIKCQVVLDRKGVRDAHSKIFGFVTFADLACATLAFQRLAGHVLFGEPMSVNWANPQKMDPAMTSTEAFHLQIPPHSDAQHDASDVSADGNTQAEAQDEEEEEGEVFQSTSSPCKSGKEAIAEADMSAKTAASIGTNSANVWPSAPYVADVGSANGASVRGLRLRNAFASDGGCYDVRWWRSRRRFLRLSRPAVHGGSVRRRACGTNDDGRFQGAHAVRSRDPVRFDE